MLHLQNVNFFGYLFLNSDPSTWLGLLQFYGGLNACRGCKFHIRLILLPGPERLAGVHQLVVGLAKRDTIPFSL